MCGATAAPTWMWRSVSSRAGRCTRGRLYSSCTTTIAHLHSGSMAEIGKGVPAGRMPRARVLIVDDFEDARELYGEFLRLQGYEVSGAADGPEALNLALPAQYDVIVLDLALPRM